MSKRSVSLKAVVGGALAALMFAGAAYAQDIRVALDAAAPVRLAAPAQGVAIGNPAIAGVSVQNERLLFVTGRAYGSTNLVVVSGDGRVIYSGRVTVTPDEEGAVMITRGPNPLRQDSRVETERLECSPICRPRPDVGEGRPMPTN